MPSICRQTTVIARRLEKYVEHVGIPGAGHTRLRRVALDAPIASRDTISLSRKPYCLQRDKRATSVLARLCSLVSRFPLEKRSYVEFGKSSVVLVLVNFGSSFSISIIHLVKIE